VCHSTQPPFGPGGVTAALWLPVKFWISVPLNQTREAGWAVIRTVLFWLWVQVVVWLRRLVVFAVPLSVRRPMASKA
jgi:hypothetical protein